jgi:hypothetical protein
VDHLDLDKLPLLSGQAKKKRRCEGGVEETKIYKDSWPGYYLHHVPSVAQWALQ